MTPSNKIKLDFGTLVLEAELFDTMIANKFFDNLPHTINVAQWGEELYGSIDIDLGEDKPIPEIPLGGIAYTNNGNYLCVFYGQTPAWPVEYIGQIKSTEWKKLLDVILVFSCFTHYILSPVDFRYTILEVVSICFFLDHH